MGLIELVVAISLLGVVMLALGAVMGTSLTLTRSNRDRVVAANLASQELELARARPFDDLQPGDVTTTETVDGVAYTVERNVAWVDQNSGDGACSESSSQDFLRLTVSVRWPSMKIPPVQNQTIITPAKGTFDPELGNIAVEVLNEEGKPAVGRTVRLSGGLTSAPLKYVPSSGCVFFSALKPSTTVASTKYTVTLPDAGYVDGNGNPTPQETGIVVTRGKTNSSPFLLASAKSMAVTLASAPNHRLPLTFPYTVANVGLQPNGTARATATGSSNPVTINNLFPWGGGYRVWAGDCLDADPEGRAKPPVGQTVGARYYPTAVRPLPAEPADGVIVDLAPVTLTVKRFNGGSLSTGNMSNYTNLANAVVTATHNDPNACPDTTARSYVVGTTDASGVLRTSMPYGSWRFTANGKTTLLTAPTPLPRIGPSAAEISFTLGIAQ